MKPSFALNLTHDKIGLLHRTSQGWHPVGEVAFADPDLTAALGYLRGSALGLEPQGFASKLVIPASEVLFLTLAAPGPTPAQRRAQIAAALDGRTPYPVEDLVFDWSGEGDTVQVAVVAKETLAEAEGFAVEHRFNPVSFVTIPPAGAFAGEPWFGTPQAAEGAAVDRDAEPVRIVSREIGARAAPATVPAAAPAVAAPPAPPPVADPVPAAPPERTRPPEARSAPPAMPADLLDAPAPAQPPAPARPAQGDGAGRRAAALPLRSVQGDAASKPRPPAKVTQARGGAVAKGVQRPATVATLPPRPGAAAATLRAVPPPGLEDEADLPPMPGRAAGGQNRASAAADAALNRGKSAARRRLPVGLILTGILVLVLGAIAIWASLFLDAPDGSADAPPSEAPAIAAAPDPAPAAPPAETAAAAAPEPPAVAEAPGPVPPVAEAPVAAAPAAEAPAAEVPPPAGSLPPVAAAAPPEADSPVAPAPADAAPAAAAAGPLADSAPATPDTRANAEPPAPPPAAPQGAVAEAARTLGTEPFEEIFLPSADSSVAAAPPPALTALAAAAPEGLPPAPMPPPPFGTVYRFDAEGRIVATPEGIVTPEGVTLVAGRPPLLPPARPTPPAEPAAVAVVPVAPAAAAASTAGIAAAPAEPPQAAPAPATAEPAAVEPAAADPALAGARPRARPGAPAPAEPAAEPSVVQEDGALDPATPGAVLLASLRPRERSDTVVAADAAARAAEAAAAAAEAAANAAASPQAVAISLKPAARPAAFARLPAPAPAATLASAAAIRAPEPAPPRAAPARTPDADEAEDNEPEVARAAPSIPSSASVARQATQRGALNLGRINLIGVYGTANNRHALVRMPGGGFQRVRVGDGLDGGEVSAIGASDLRYTKGGRTVTLAMPRG